MHPPALPELDVEAEVVRDPARRSPRGLQTSSPGPGHVRGLEVDVARSACHSKTPHRCYGLGQLAAAGKYLGRVENQSGFYDRFDHVVLLSTQVEALIERIARRTNSPFRRTSAQQDEVRQNMRDVEAQLRSGATSELCGRQSIATLADAFEALQ